MLRLIKATLALRLALAILTRWRRPAPPPPAPAPAARPAPSAKPDGRRVFSVVALLVVSVVGVVVLLRTDSPPPAYERKEIVFKPPAAGLPDRAFTAAMSVSAYGCDKRADVALVYAASAEYWIDHRGRLGERPKFSVELPPGVSEVRVGVTDALDSFHPFGLGVPPRKTRRLRYTLTTTGRGHTRVRGSLRNWARKWDALKLTFNVDWGSARTLGTCYLQVPELVGEGNVAFLPPYLRRNDLTARLERLTRDPTSESPARLRRIARDLLGASGSNSADHVSFGVVRVLPVQGEVVAEQSRRPPDTYDRGEPTWVCDYVDRIGGSFGTQRERVGGRVSDTVMGPDGSAHSMRLYREPLAKRGCANTVVLAGSSAATARDTALITVGALVSAFVTVLLSGGLAPWMLALLIVPISVFVAAARTGFSMSVTAYMNGATLGGTAFLLVGMALWYVFGVLRRPGRARRDGPRSDTRGTR